MNALKIQIQMSSRSADQDYTILDDSLEPIFGNLCPPEQDENPVIIKRKSGLAWMKSTNKQNGKNKKNKQPKQKKGRQEEVEREAGWGGRQQRSRSRERRPDNMTIRQANGQERDYIEISDDQEGDAELLQRYYCVGNQYYLKDGYESMNWRERRRLERLFARQEKKYRQGKQKDQLSFTLFNTIQHYFR